MSYTFQLCEKLLHSHIYIYIYCKYSRARETGAAARDVKRRELYCLPNELQLHRIFEIYHRPAPTVHPHSTEPANYFICETEISQFVSVVASSLTVYACNICGTMFYFKLCSHFQKMLICCKLLLFLESYPVKQNYVKMVLIGLLVLLTATPFLVINLTAFLRQISSILSMTQTTVRYYL
jgi:hypothetical protein